MTVPRPEAAPIQVAVSVSPLRSLLEELGGPQLEVRVLFSPGRDIESTPARPRDLVRLETARLVWWIDRPAFVAEARTVRPWLARHPEVERLSLAEVADRLSRRIGAPSPGGCPGRDPHSGHGDPHLWLSPRIIAASLQPLEERLRRLLPREASALTQRRQELERRVTALSQTLEAWAGSRARKTFLVHHPAFGVLGQELGLLPCALEVHGREPSARRLRQIFSWARSEGLRSVLVASGTRPPSMRVLAREAQLEPVEYSVFDSDWFAMMEGLQLALAKVLE